MPNSPTADGNDPLSYVRIREQHGLRPGGFGIRMARAMVDVSTRTARLEVMPFLNNSA